MTAKGKGQILQHLAKTSVGADGTSASGRRAIRHADQDTNFAHLCVLLLILPTAVANSHLLFNLAMLLQGAVG